MSAGREVTIIVGCVFAVFVLALVVVVLLGTTRPTSDDAARSARAWADTLGMRITGVVCDRERCTVAPEKGQPFIVYCDAKGCSLPEKNQ